MQNNKGFGLIEVMVCVVLMSIVMAGSVQYMDYQLAQAQTIETKNNLTSLISTVAQTLQNEATCTAAITNTPQKYGSYVTLVLPDGFTLGINSKATDYDLVIKSVQLMNVAKVDTDYKGNTYYYVTVVLNAAAAKAVVGPRDFRPRAVAPIYLTVNASNVITGCGATKPTLPVKPPGEEALPEPEAVKESKEDYNAKYKECVNKNGNWNNGTCTSSKHDDNDGPC